MKKIVIMALVVILAGCTARKKTIEKRTNAHNEVELNGHSYWFVTVGSVSGHSIGTVSQLVHDPDCWRCEERLDSIVRAVLRSEGD